MVKKNKNDIIGIEPVTQKVKKHHLRNFLRQYDFQRLKNEIESYGYSYSFTRFALTGLLYAGVIIAVAHYIELSTQNILILCVALVGVIPFIVRSQFEQLYQMERFEMITSYLDNIIPIFKKRPIIIRAWEDLLDICEGEMKEVIQKAFELVRYNTSDPDALKNAFLIIEESFPNSRIHSVHQMMFTIEKQNTKNYTISVDNMWVDVQAWITRTTTFQNSLRERKTHLMLLSLLSMFSNCLFVVMYSANEIFATFTENIVYQISTTGFMLGIIALLCTFQIRLNGKWILDDKTVEISKNAMKSFEYLQKTPEPEDSNFLEKIILGIFIILSITIFVLSDNMILAGAVLFIGYMAYTQSKRTYRTHKKNIKEYLEIEFPTWMRDISINLHNLTVINAIQSSKDSSSEIMRYYIDKLVKEIYDNPTSIIPYNNFLSEFKIDGVRTAMKSLYSMQEFNREEIQKQTNSLIVRNQTMLDHTERMKNEKAVSGMRLLGFAPVGLLITQMLINMALMFWFMLTLMGNILNGVV